MRMAEVALSSPTARVQTSTPTTVHTRPSTPNFSPIFTSSQRHTRHRSAAGPLPRSLVMANATSAANTVGVIVPMSTSRTGSDSTVFGPSTAPTNAAVASSTPSTNRNAPNPHRWVRGRYLSSAVDSFDASRLGSLGNDAPASVPTGSISRAGSCESDALTRAFPPPCHDLPPEPTSRSGRSCSAEEQQRRWEVVGGVGDDARAHPPGDHPGRADGDALPEQREHAGRFPVHL